jgi:hypothetical protein
MPPRSALHYEARATADFTDQGGGHLVARVGDADVEIALDPHAPHIEVGVGNPTARAVTVRLGPQATHRPEQSIGELQHQPLDAARAEGRSEFLPFLSMQSIEVVAGTRTVFHLDDPLGREPVVGHYMVLVLEVDGADGRRDRRLLPLVATNIGTAAGR